MALRDIFFAVVGRPFEQSCSFPSVMNAILRKSAIELSADC
jgi:hypothetical protein